MGILVESLDTAGWGVMKIPHGGSMTIKDTLYLFQ